MTWFWRDCAGRRLVLTVAAFVAVFTVVEIAIHVFGFDVKPFIPIGGPR